MPFDKKRYDIEYSRAHVRRKFIPFNDMNPDDAQMLEYLSGKENVTQFIKRLIWEDMTNKNGTIFADSESKR